MASASPVFFPANVLPLPIPQHTPPLNFDGSLPFKLCQHILPSNAIKTRPQRRKSAAFRALYDYFFLHLLKLLINVAHSFLDRFGRCWGRFWDGFGPSLDWYHRPNIYVKTYTNFSVST